MILFKFKITTQNYYAKDDLQNLPNLFTKQKKPSAISFECFTRNNFVTRLKKTVDSSQS